MYSKPRQLTRKLLVSAAAVTLLLGAAACGDDDDEDSADTDAPAATEAPTATDAPTATEAPAADAAETTVDHGTMDMSGTTEASDSDSAAAPAGDVDTFCQAELEAEAAANSEDPAAMGPAFEALVAAAPADIKATVESVIANAENGPGDPAFDEPYGEMIGFMKDNCGFTNVSVTTSEYAFGGLPEEMAAGPAIFTVTNIGEEVHEMILFRINDDVTATAEELLALPEEEAETMAVPTAFAFVFPEVESFTTSDLEPGRYFAVCFLPKDNTPEMISQMEGPDSSLPPGAGPPHFTEGMVHEFTVA